MRRRTVRAAGGAAAALLGLVGAGCGVLPGSSSPPSSAPPTGGASSSTAPTAPSGSATPTSGPTDAGPVLGTRTFSVAGTYSGTRLQMRLDLVALKRRGDLLDLEARLSNLSTDMTKDQRWQVAGRFNGAVRDDLNATDGAFSGVTITDLPGKKRYLVAADSARACVCTTGLSSTFVGAGQTLELDATYAAPPTSTTTVDVSVPTLGTFRDVPIG